MSIASALFSESQSRVFRWLFGQPGRAFHLSELRRLTGLGSASLQRELNRLAEAGLVQSERVGNLRCFQANPQSPVYGELIGLTRKTVGMEPLLREALLPFSTAKGGVDFRFSGRAVRHLAKRYRHHADWRELVAGRHTGTSDAAGSAVGPENQPDQLYACRLRASPCRTGLVRQSHSFATNFVVDRGRQ